MANSDLRLLRQLLLEEGYWVVKTEADKRYRALQASTTGQQPAAATRSTSYKAQQSPLPNDVGHFGSSRPGTHNLRLNGSGTGSFAPAASMHVQPDTATVRASGPSLSHVIARQVPSTLEECMCAPVQRYLRGTTIE